MWTPVNTLDLGLAAFVLADPLTAAVLLVGRFLLAAASGCFFHVDALGAPAGPLLYRDLLIGTAAVSGFRAEQPEAGGEREPP